MSISLIATVTLPNITLSTIFSTSQTATKPRRAQTWAMSVSLSPHNTHKVHARTHHTRKETQTAFVVYI